jgi:hypothetical protein
MHLNIEAKKIERSLRDAGFDWQHFRGFKPTAIDEPSLRD